MWPCRGGAEGYDGEDNEENCEQHVGANCSVRAVVLARGTVVFAEREPIAIVVDSASLDRGVGRYREGPRGRPERVRKADSSEN
jgi:hypothetical protein